MPYYSITFRNVHGESHEDAARRLLEVLRRRNPYTDYATCDVRQHDTDRTEEVRAVITSDYEAMLEADAADHRDMCGCPLGTCDGSCTR